MSKGKGKRNYDEEIEQAAKRMKKYPEHLRSALHSKEWIDFLLSIEVNPDTIESSKGSSFWDKVREKVKEDIETYTGTRREQRRDAKGHFAKGFTGRVYTYVIYRSASTKKIVGYEVIRDLTNKHK